MDECALAKHADVAGSEHTCSLEAGGVLVLSAIEVGESGPHAHATNNVGARDVAEGTAPEGYTSAKFPTDEVKPEVQKEKEEERSGERGAHAGCELPLVERSDDKARLSAATACTDVIALRLTGGIGQGCEACRGPPKERGGVEGGQTLSSQDGGGDLCITYHTYQTDDQLSTTAVSVAAEEKRNSELLRVSGVTLRNVGRVCDSKDSSLGHNGAYIGTHSNASPGDAQGFFHLCLSSTGKCVYDTDTIDAEKEQETKTRGGGRRAFLVIFKLTADFEDHWCDDYVSKDVCVGFARIARRCNSGAHCIGLEASAEVEEGNISENNTRTPRISHTMPSSDFSIVLGIGKEDYYPITHYIKGTITSSGTRTILTHAHNVRANADTTATTATAHLSSENSNNVTIFDNRFCQKEYPTRSLTTTRRYAVLLVLDAGDEDVAVDNDNGTVGSTNTEGHDCGGYFRAFRSESGLECDMKPFWEKRRFTLPPRQPLSGGPFGGHEQKERDRQRSSSYFEYALVGNLFNRRDEITIEHIFVDGEVTAHYLR